ncbi:MAG: addiction module protein [Acidobacteriota bacterium]
MKVPATSVFDLSPAEKLRLVEDLWDDLPVNLKTFRFMTGR